MNPGTATNRLLKDILFDFVIKANHKCHQCGEELTRETFSIEHVEPWLHSENPVEKFFDLTNIKYSHLKCNTAAARRPTKLPEGEALKRNQKYRREYMRKRYSKESRRQKYKMTGH